MRRATAATLIVTAGLLAALPFRRPAGDTPEDPSAGIVTGPSSGAIDSVSTSPTGQWSAGLNFDPSLAWQPVPSDLPQRRSPELPPMPDSYYDVALDLEQPDPIRQRFSAAAENRELTTPPRPPSQTGQTSPTGQTGQTLAYRSDRIAGEAQPPHQAASHPRPTRPLAAEEVIKDRFVYTPLAPAKTPVSPGDQGNQQRTPAQSASMVRPGTAPVEQGARQRYFIREPQ